MARLYREVVLIQQSFDDKPDMVYAIAMRVNEDKLYTLNVYAGENYGETIDTHIIVETPSSYDAASMIMRSLLSEKISDEGYFIVTDTLFEDSSGVSSLNFHGPVPLKLGETFNCSAKFTWF